MAFDPRYAPSSVAIVCRIVLFVIDSFMEGKYSLVRSSLMHVHRSVMPCVKHDLTCFGRVKRVGGSFLGSTSLLSFSPSLVVSSVSVHVSGNLGWFSLTCSLIYRKSSASALNFGLVDVDVSS